jgi:cytochrome P450
VGRPGRPVHALSRFQDVEAATNDWATFCSTGKLEAVYTKPTMNSFDPPRQTKLRALISRGFTPRRVSDLEPQVRDIASQLLDRFVGAGKADVIADYAGPMPSMVMGRLIGRPTRSCPCAVS